MTEAQPERKRFHIMQAPAVDGTPEFWSSAAQGRSAEKSANNLHDENPTTYVFVVDSKNDDVLHEFFPVETDPAAVAVEEAAAAIDAGGSEQEAEMEPVQQARQEILTAEMSRAAMQRKTNFLDLARHANTPQARAYWKARAEAVS